MTTVAYAEIPLEDVPFHDAKTSPPEPTAIQKKNPNNWCRRLLKGHHGYRLGVLCSIFTVLLVFLVNLITTIWAASTNSNPHNASTGVLYSGNCNTASTVNIWLHIAINILSTATLSASNYVAQTLVAPSRADIDRAHAKRRWMDIGVPSIRNLFWIDWKRVVLWTIIGFSSLPLHLLYNSAVFGTTSANSYFVAVGATNLLDPPALEAMRKNLTVMDYWSQAMNQNPGELSNASFMDSYAQYTWYTLDEASLGFLESVAASMLENATEWETMGPVECAQAYNHDMMVDYSDLVVFLEGNVSATDVGGVYCGTYWLDSWDDSWEPAQTWICEDNPGLGHGWTDGNGTDICDPDRTVQQLVNGGVWKQCGKPVMECKARKTPETDSLCKVQLSMAIMGVVIAFNGLKVVAMGLALRRWTCAREKPIVTVGDAVASFMQEEDATTEGFCTADKRFFESRAGRTAWNRGLYILQAWEARRPRVRWWKAVRWTRWTVCYALITGALGGTCYLLASGLTGNSLHGLNIDIKSIWSRGIGEPNVNSLISLDLSSSRSSSHKASIITAALLSNIPQIVLSSLYFLYNSIFTCMLMAAEWSRFAVTRKALRVTDPKGEQRSTHYLHLPYKWGVPLALLSFWLHWITSQCIFLVSIEFLSSPAVAPASKSAAQVMNSVGYSVLAIIFVVPMIVLGMLGPVLVGARRFASGMPIAGSCSAAVSAACHWKRWGGEESDEEEEEGDEATKPVMWGVVNGQKEDGLERLAFSPEKVRPPEDLVSYA